MVLEEASSPQEPTASYSETQPTSDVDRYPSSSNPEYLPTRAPSYLQLNQPGAPEPLHINLNNLPRPFAIFFQTQHSQSLANGIHATCSYASKILQRPLRQEEADAFAWHWAKSMRMASYGTPVGVSAAMLWAWRYTDYRFPFWKPMKEGSGYSPDKLGPLRGPTARAAWQVLRFNAYGFVGMALGQLFFASYALTVHAAGRAMDPRLKEFTEALKQRQSEGLTMARAREMAREGGEAPRQGETFEMARQRRAAAQQQREEWRKQRERGRKQSSGDDDMSPTGGSFAEDFMDTGSDTGLMSDGQSREQQYRAENATSTFGLSNERATESRSSAMADGSPQPPQQQSQPSPPKQAGSAWERLRQTAMSGNPANPPPNSPGSSTSVRSTPSATATKSDDSFSFSQTEEDKQLARSEAQKEFDARIEREREGRNFDDSSGGGRKGRW